MVLGAFSPAVPQWESWLYWFPGQRQWGWRLLRCYCCCGLQAHRWTGPPAYADRTLCVFSTSRCRAPPECTGAPEWNINHPNSIYGSQSYFLDEQCRHFCVIDDEQVGTVQCSHHNEVRAGNKSIVKSVVACSPKLRICVWTTKQTQTNKQKTNNLDETFRFGFPGLPLQEGAQSSCWQLNSSW